MSIFIPPRGGVFNAPAAPKSGDIWRQHADSDVRPLCPVCELFDVLTRGSHYRDVLGTL
jgi:hypothetical protein